MARTGRSNYRSRRKDKDSSRPSRQDRDTASTASDGKSRYARASGSGSSLKDSLQGIIGRIDKPFSWIQNKVDILIPWLVPRLYWLVEFIHLWTGKILGFTIGKIAKGVNYVPWSIRFAVFFAIMAYFSLRLAIDGQWWLLEKADFYEKHLVVLEQAGIIAALRGCAAAAVASAVLCALVIPLSLLRMSFVLRAFQIAAASFAAMWCYFLTILVRGPSVLNAFDHTLVDKYYRNELWIRSVPWWFVIALVPAFTFLALVMKSVRRLYELPEESREPLGDRIVEDLRTHGEDPRYRTSFYWSSFLHLAILIYPFLLRGCGMEAPYAIPQGSGNPVVEMVKVKKKKKKKKKKYILAQNSPFIFERLDIDESKVMEEVDEVTEREYVANKNIGKMGQGGGTSGGWPNGMPGVVRFIRLKYNGGDWDQDMGKGADHNFLIRFQEFTSFKVANDTEYIPIHRLDDFPKDRAPPFVFITGKGGISAGGDDVRVLRWYCLEEGGMIFADNGGGSFDASFRALVRRVFPDKQWIDIPNDDILYRQPFEFPNGAPALWHHSGYRALGIKHNGRWVVFYHQGDMNDAWKDGHSGAPEGVAMASYKLGVNIMYYAFTRYLSIHGPKQ